MASHTINGQPWPSGTLVSVYPGDAQPAGRDGVPMGVPVDSATVSGASVTFSNVVVGRRYVAYASGVSRRFLVQPGSVDTLRPISGTEAQALRDSVTGLDAELATVQAGLDLKFTDYVGVNRTGGAAMNALLNQAGSDASALAVANGHRCVNLIVPRGDYRLDDYVQFYDRVRYKGDEARFFLGADLAGNGAFRTINPTSAPVAAVAQGTADTVNGDYVLRNVSLPALWDDSMIVTGAGIPALAHVLTVDAAQKYIVLDKPCTATATGVAITKAAGWWGLYNNCGISGITLDPNGFRTGFGIAAYWTQGFYSEHVDVLHNRKADGSDASWAWAVIQARDAVFKDPKVTGGRAVWEDGFHISGTRINVLGLNSDSGDDSLAIGEENFAGIAATQFPSRFINVVNPICTSNRGYAVKIYTLNGVSGGIFDVSVVGMTGRAGVYRNGGCYIVNDSVAAPGSNKIARVSIEGSLDIGSPAHDGSKGNNTNGAVPALITSGPCLYTQNADDVYYDVALRVDQPAAGPVARVIYMGVGCDNLRFGPRCSRLDVVRGDYTLTNFNNCPRLGIGTLPTPGNLSRETSTVEFKDDFTGRALDTVNWLASLGTDGDCAVAPQAAGGRGILQLSTGNDPAGTMATNGAQITGGLAWHRENGNSAQGLWMEAVARQVGATLAFCSFVGFTDQNTALEMPFTLSGVTLTANATDAVGILLDSAAATTHYYGVVVVAGVTQLVDLGVDSGYATASFDRLSIYAQTDGRVTFHVNGVKRGVATIAPSVLLAPCAAIFSRGGLLRFLYVDMIRCQMQRLNY